MAWQFPNILLRQDGYAGWSGKPCVRYHLMTFYTYPQLLQQTSPELGLGQWAGSDSTSKAGCEAAAKPGLAGAGAFTQSALGLTKDHRML
jgi:hypothetical protein